MTQNMVDILLVEDRAEDAELTIMGLKSHNMMNEIKWVKDGEEALEYIFAHGRYSERNIKDQPKLVLLDLHMPKVNGMEVLKAIKADNRVKHLPVIMLTSSKEEEDLVRAYDLNVNAFIIKPVGFPAFVEAMKTMGMFWVLLNKRPEWK